jgi:putative Holliday junction resolvase
VSAPASTLLCFDYGEKRIGVAVGQTLTGTATALTTLAARDGRPDWERVAALIAEWQPQALVVGLPLNMDGTEQALSARARRFANRLRGRHALPLHFADERLSTREARHLEDGAEPRQGRDALAAQVILEGWMAGARLEEP